MHAGMIAQLDSCSCCDGFAAFSTNSYVTSYENRYGGYPQKCENSWQSELLHKKTDRQDLHRTVFAILL